MVTVATQRRSRAARRRRLGWALVPLCSCFALSSPALADGPDVAPRAKPLAIAADARPEVADSGESARRAAAWVHEAERHFENGNARAAIPLLERAYEAMGWEGCLLNLGMAHHSLGDCPRARGYYERYLDNDPYAVRRHQVELALAELDHRCEPPASPLVVVEAKPLGADVVQPLATTESIPPLAWEQARAAVPAEQRVADPTKGRYRTLAVVGFGVAGAGATTALLFLAQGERYEADARELAAAQRSPLDDTAARAVDAKGQQANALAVGFGTASLAVLAGSAVLWFFGSEGPRAPVLALTQGSASVHYAAQF